MDSKSCSRCGRRILVALTNGGKAAAVDVVLDPDPLTPLGELDAQHAGRRTWTLHHTGDVHARGARQITTWPAGSGQRRTVHADHQCQGQGGQGA